MKIEFSKEDLYEIYLMNSDLTNSLYYDLLYYVEEKYNVDYNCLDSETKNEIFFLAIKGLMELELLEFEAPDELYSKGFIRNQKTGRWDASSDEIIEYFKKHMPNDEDDKWLGCYEFGYYCPMKHWIYTNDIPSPIKLNIEFSDEELLKIRDDNYKGFLFTVYDDSIKLIANKNNIKVCDINNDRLKKEIFLSALKRMLDLELVVLYPPKVLEAKEEIEQEDYQRFVWFSNDGGKSRVLDDNPLKNTISRKYIWDLNNDEMINYLKENMPNNPWHKDYKNTKGVYWFGDYCPTLGWVDTNNIPSLIKLNIEFSDEELLKIRDDNYKGFLFTIYDDSIKLIANKNNIKVCDINNDRLKKEIFLTALKRMLDLELVVLYPPKVLEAKEEIEQEDYQRFIRVLDDDGYSWILDDNPLKNTISRKYIWDLNNDEMINYLKENMPNNPWHKDYKNTKGVYWFGDYCPTLGWVDLNYIHYATNQGIMYVEFLKENKTGIIDTDFSDEELNNISMGLYGKHIDAMYSKIKYYIVVKNKISLRDELLDDKTSTEALCNVLKKFSEKGLITFIDIPKLSIKGLFCVSLKHSFKCLISMIRFWKIDVDVVIYDIKEKGMFDSSENSRPIIIWHKKEYK